MNEFSDFLFLYLNIDVATYDADGSHGRIMYCYSGTLLVISCWTRNMDVSWENLVSLPHRSVTVFNVFGTHSVYSLGLDI